MAKDMEMDDDIENVGIMQGFLDEMEDEMEMEEMDDEMDVDSMKQERMDLLEERIARLESMLSEEEGEEEEEDEDEEDWRYA